MIYFQKSQPAPKSLTSEKAKKNGTYRTNEVIERLSADFKNKCYICELKSTTLQIEHFKPHRNNVNLMFDWNNLFWACGHCNNIKGDNLLYDNILNCTDKTHDIENKLKFIFQPFAAERVEIQVIDNSETTKNTQKLLFAVYNGTTIQKEKESINLLDFLLSEFDKFNGFLLGYLKSENEDTKKYYSEKIKLELDGSSNFTAFKRWEIRENYPKLKAEFEKYFD
jgi:uncharacterized protein (TIGR02646 family)